MCAPSISAHVSETNVQSSRSLCTVEEILGVHPMNDDDFWGNTNPIDVSFDTANSEDIMTGSYITELHTHTHTHKHEESLTTELLYNILNVPKVYDTIEK